MGAGLEGMDAFVVMDTIHTILRVLRKGKDAEVNEFFALACETLWTVCKTVVDTQAHVKVGGSQVMWCARAGWISGGRGESLCIKARAALLFSRGSRGPVQAGGPCAGGGPYTSRGALCRQGRGGPVLAGGRPCTSRRALCPCGGSCIHLLPTQELCRHVQVVVTAMIPFAKQPTPEGAQVMIVSGCALLPRSQLCHLLTSQHYITFLSTESPFSALYHLSRH